MSISFLHQGSRVFADPLGQRGSDDEIDKVDICAGYVDPRSPSG